MKGIEFFWLTCEDRSEKALALVLFYSVNITSHCADQLLFTSALECSGGNHNPQHTLRGVKMFLSLSPLLLQRF